MVAKSHFIGKSFIKSVNHSAQVKICLPAAVLAPDL